MLIYVCIVSAGGTPEFNGINSSFPWVRLSGSVSEHSDSYFHCLEIILEKIWKEKTKLRVNQHAHFMESIPAWNSVDSL